MAKPPHWLHGVADVLRAPTGDLRKLAEIAGEDPRVLFVGTIMDGVDICGQDLSGILLPHLDLSKVRHDAQTKIDPPSADLSAAALKSEFSYQDLLASVRGRLFGPASPRLPAPPMLLFDRIISVTRDGGHYGLGVIEAELEITPDLWFFDCSYVGDPFMPIALGFDALTQLMGFYLSWVGRKGRLRVLGVGGIRPYGNITPSGLKVTYKVDIKRIDSRSVTQCVGDGTVQMDGETILTATEVQVGLQSGDRTN